MWATIYHCEKLCVTATQVSCNQCYENLTLLLGHACVVKAYSKVFGCCKKKQCNQCCVNKRHYVLVNTVGFIHVYSLKLLKVCQH